MDTLPYDIQEYIYHLKHNLELKDVLNDIIKIESVDHTCEAYKCNNIAHIRDMLKISDDNEYEDIYLCVKCFQE